MPILRNQQTNEASTPPEVFAIRRPDSSANGPGWSVRVVPNSDPRLRIEGVLGRRAEGFHDLMNGVGAHEIIAETPRHDRSLHELEIGEICDVIRAYVARLVDLEGDKRMRYVLIFKNGKRNTLIGLAVGVGTGADVGAAANRVVGEAWVVPGMMLGYAGLGAGIGALVPAAKIRLLGRSAEAGRPERAVGSRTTLMPLDTFKEALA